MAPTLSYLLLFLAAFTIGSIPSGFIIGLLHGVDIRTQGSGNIGATNLKRVLGKKAGAFTLAADLAKGAAAAGLGIAAEHHFGQQNSGYLAPLLGAAGVYGHCFSPFLAFKGGKGVAAALGAFLVLAPLAAVCSAVIFGVVYKMSGYVSAGSLAGAISLPLTIAIAIDGELKIGLLVSAALVTFLILARHSDNITRLREGSELSAGADKK